MAKSGAIAVKKADSSVNREHEVSGHPHRIEFEVAHGGLISKTHKKHKGGEYHEPESAIHSSMKEAQTHLLHLGHAFDLNEDS